MKRPGLVVDRIQEQEQGKLDPKLVVLEGAGKELHCMLTEAETVYIASLESREKPEGRMKDPPGLGLCFQCGKQQSRKSRKLHSQSDIPSSLQ